MRTHKHPLGTIYVPSYKDSLKPLARLAEEATVWGADTEATGLHQYAQDFDVRLVQVGTRDEAWILRPDWDEHLEAIGTYTALQGGDLLGEKTWWHNWVYDGIALEVALGLDIDETFQAAGDTDILSRLYDPRPPQKGGTGHKLKDLADKYVLKGVKDARAVLLAEGKRLFGPRNFTQHNMWSMIPIDNHVFEIYAGQDVLLACRLAEHLLPLVLDKGLNKFIRYETARSREVAEMQRQGMPLDLEWTDRAIGEYMAIHEEAERELIEVHGVDKTATYAATSGKSIKSKLEEHKVVWRKFSEKTGEPSLDKSVLAELSADKNPKIAKMAQAIRLSKTNKHYADYLEAMVKHLGTDGRIHPNVRPMAAATHRMSISDPPIQQFPRDDPRVRGALLADPGHVIITADYAQIEYRVAAAVSQDPVMIQMILNGEDLHGVAAAAVFGPDFNKGQRQACKPIGLGRLYLGGAPGIYKQMAESDTTGYLPTLAQVQKGAKAFDTKFAVYNRWATRLKAKVERANGHLTTATGRKLIVEPYYAAANYAIQSVARDLFMAAIARIHKAGYGQEIRLVVHDEIVLSTPEHEAEERLAQVVEWMQTEFLGVPIEVEPEIKGPRWAK